MPKRLLMDLPTHIPKSLPRSTQRAWRHRAPRSRRLWTPIAATTLAVFLACLPAAPAAAAPSAGTACVRAATTPDPSYPPNQALLLDYRAWNGTRRQAVVLLPAGYAAGQAALPCVIAAHGRDMPPAVVAQRWGALPTELDFAVICADSAGVREAYNSWAAPGQLRDLMRLPALLQRAAPWVRLDPSRTYAAGVSMGAQEVLCLAARYPDRLAGVAAFDGVTDLSARYGEVLLSARGGPGVLKRMRHEMGGTPQQAPFAYRQRSPSSYAATLATAGVPVQLWWSPRDVRVINQSTTQTGELYRRICRLGPAPQVTEIRTDLAHGVAFSAAKGFEQMLAGFRPSGDWLTTQAVAPESWTYVGSLRAASFWGYGVRLARPPHTLWRVRLEGTTALVQSREALRLTVPCPGPAREVRVTVNGKPQTAVAFGGSFTVRIPAGTSVVRMEQAGAPAR
jgi:hypothetical protein